MSKKRKGWLFEFPLIATEPTSGKIVIEPDPAGSNFKHWNAGKKELTFYKKDFPPMKKGDHHYVEFTLDDQTTRKLRFPCNPEDAMWVITTARCPNKSDTCNYDIVQPLGVVEGDTLLAVNLNPVVGQLGFSLNFVKAGDDDTDPSKYIRWDPIINNRDGGI